MPTTHKQKNYESGRWKQEDLERVINAVKGKSMGINAVSKAFEIPSRTLRRRILQDNYKRSLGPAAYSGSDAEIKMVLHIQQMQAAGFALSRKDVQILAFILAQKSGIKHRFCVAEGLVCVVMRPHREISVRKAEGISLSRAQGMNKEVTSKYFDLLKKTLMENDLMKKPSYIFNSDETGLQLNNKPRHVLAKKGSTDVHLLTSAEKGEIISVIACCSAGHFLPPVCTF
jgi:hypothetical protein